MLEKLFRLDEHRTTIRIEIIAGLTTYLTMAYIVFVNPLILSGAGMDRGAVFVVMVALDRLAVPGAIIIAILASALTGILLGISPFAGVIDTPPSLAPTFLALDLRGALDIGIATVIFVFLFVDLFDNTGTLVGVAHRAGLLDEHGKLRASAGCLSPIHWPRWVA